EGAREAIGVGLQSVGFGADPADTLLAPALPVNVCDLVGHGGSLLLVWVTGWLVVGQWGEFGFAGHGGEFPPLPSPLGVLDALVRGGDEIPPDVPRRGKAFASQEHGQ